MENTYRKRLRSALMLGILIIAGLYGLAFHIAPILAAPPGSAYAPGETLNPSCAPGDTNCTVSASVGVSGSGTAQNIAFWSATSTLSATTSLNWDDTNGRLGIGTSSPSGLLTISGASSTLVIDNTGGRKFSLRNGVQSTNSFDIFDHASSSSRLVINNLGQISIGTTTATSTLNLSATGGSSLTFASNSAGTPMQWRLRSGSFGSGNGTFDLFDSAASTTRAYFDSSGRVSFGTSTVPTETKLYVYGGPSGANIDARSSAADQSATIELQSYDFSDTFKSTWLQHSGPSVFGNVLDTNVPIADSGRLSFQGVTNAVIYTSSAAPIVFGTDYAERMRILANGKIGIATTTPATSLHVEGTIRAKCLILMNSDGTNTANYITALNGVLSTATTKPAACE